ncbi:MAG TPA: beta-propeller fold lactonase family protein [Terriglobia bacterium]|nr:beta-propeller fold lactonase family protein [Terriglobia bacterium]
MTLRSIRWLSAAAITVLVLGAGLGWRQSLRAGPAQRPDWTESTEPRYLTPVALQLSPNGQRLYVVCQDSNLLLAVDTHSQQVVERVKVGRKPAGIALSPDGNKLYVSSEWSNTISEIDADSFRVRRTLDSGWGPVGITTDRSGKVLYVANTQGDNVSLIDLTAGHEIKRLDAGRFPEYLARSRDGRFVYVSNLLARVATYDEPVVSELTVIDTTRQVVSQRVEVPGAIQLRHITEVPASAGGYLLVPFMRPKNMNPLIHLQQGWYLTHGLAVIRLEGNSEAPKARVAEVLLDDIDHYYADGMGAASTPDGRWVLVTASGANVVSVIDTAKLNSVLRQVPASNPEALANRLDSARQFVAQRLPTGRNPAAVVVSPDGCLAYIANRMDDTISVVDLRLLRVASTIDLGGPKEITAVRRGESLFFDARYSFQGQLACATCHPHIGLSDGLAWVLESPQLGRDVVENRTLLSIAQTSPYKWNGKNLDLATQDGPRTARYIFRSEGFSQSEVKDLVTFINSLRLSPNPHLASGGRLNESQSRGRAIFFRITTNDGRLIPPQKRCYYCHPPLTHYTSRVAMNVGTATRYDTIQSFDIPQIEGVYMRAPYLHNGEALSLEEIWTKFNPEDKHGITSDMDKVQLNDLIEYLKTL